MTRNSRSILLGLCAAAALIAQDTPLEPPQPPAAGGGRGGAAAALPDPQPYDRVITKEAKTTRGLFIVHQIKERYYYEIPKTELGKEFLWIRSSPRPRSAPGTAADSWWTASSAGISRATASS